MRVVVGNIVSLNDAEVRGQIVVRAVDSDGGAGGVVACGVGRNGGPVSRALSGVLDGTCGFELCVRIEVRQRRGNRCADGISNAGHAVLGIERQRVLMVGTVQGGVGDIGAGAGCGEHIAAGSDVRRCEHVSRIGYRCRRVGHLDGGAWIIVCYIETKCEFSSIQFLSVKPYRQRMVCIHVDAAGEGGIKCRAA